MRTSLDIVGRTLAATALAVAVAAGCQRASRAEQGARPNLLVIVVDALRADRLGAYGNRHGLTPFLDSLAARGIVFQNAYAASCWTNPSVASLFTSRPVWQHGVNSFAAVLSASEVTLAEVLAEHGYGTAGGSANLLIGERQGFAQGFGSYVTPWVHAVDGVKANIPARADEISGPVLEWWRREREGRGPAFLYLHYVETHTPYAPPAATIEHVFRGQPWPNIDEVNAVSLLFGVYPADDRQIRDVQGLYDAEVLAIDGGLARLFADLEREGFLRDAVVVFTADHGEELWDHGRFGHGSTMFNELTRVPLIMLVPGRDTRLDVSEVVSLVDVAPTLLDFAGIAQPPSFAGHSFRALMAPPSWRNLFGLVPRSWSAPWHDTALSDMGLNGQSAKAHPPDGHLRAIVVGARKLITTRDGGTQYYDLARDAPEKQQGAVTEADRETLVEALGRVGPPAGHDPAAAEVLPVDEEHKARLRALGYAD
jgi:arylsulfatase A-like enzyme